MKKALKLLLYFFIFLICGIGCGSILYGLYLNILNTTAGNAFIDLNTDTYLKALFYIILCVSVVICPLLAFVHIKHKGGVIQLIFYFILCAVIWLAVIPFSIYFKQKLISDVKIEKEKLSAHYFRKIDDKVYFLTNDLSDYRSSTVVVLDTSPDGKVSIDRMMESTSGDLYKAAEPYRDVNIKTSFSMGRNTLLPDFQFLADFADSNFNREWYYWLSFLSLGLVLCSLYAISGLFSWKLIDVGFISIITYLILYINTKCLSTPVIYSVIKKINSSALFAKLGKYMQEPFVVFLNVLLALIFIITGIIKFSVEKKRLRHIK